MKKMTRYVPEKFNLPLFCLTRHQLKDRQDEINDYLKKRAPSYASQCVRAEESKDKGTKRNLKKIDLKEQDSSCPGPKRILQIKSEIKQKPWQLPPNRYDVPKEPYASKKGKSGAYWSKLEHSKGKIQTKPVNKGRDIWKFYDKPDTMDVLSNKHKGVLRKDLRHHRGATRLHVFSLIDCYKRPEDPHAANYYSKLHEFQYNAAKPILHERPNPHIFYKALSVPATKNSIHNKNTASQPGPGRYETRFREVGHCCPPHLIFKPDIWTEIQYQKRLKFRQKPFKKIKRKLYCSPEWRHVRGRGHKRLFKNIPPRPRTRKVQLSARMQKRLEKLNMFADAKYIKIINEPKREPISFLNSKVPQKPPTIIFNCMQKKIPQKKMKDDKRIAFMSGQQRFKDSSNPLPITAAQLQKIVASLPPERRLQEHPVMTKPKASIPSKLMKVSEYMKPLYQPILRKKSFKFSPLPEPRELVTEADTRGELVKKNFRVGGYYCSPIDPKKYFKPIEEIDPKYRQHVLAM